MSKVKCLATRNWMKFFRDWYKMNCLILIRICWRVTLAKIHFYRKSQQLLKQWDKQIRTLYTVSGTMYSAVSDIVFLHLLFRAVCDPVLGDNGALYVPKALIPIYQNEIIPLSDICTPNQFEAELLTGVTIESESDAWTALNWFHGKGVKTAVLSSTNIGTEGTLTSFLSHKNGKFIFWFWILSASTERNHYYLSLLLQAMMNVNSHCKYQSLAPVYNLQVLAIYFRLYSLHIPQINRIQAKHLSTRLQRCMQFYRTQSTPYQKVGAFCIVGIFQKQFNVHLFESKCKIDFYAMLVLQKIVFPVGLRWDSVNWKSFRANET